MIKLIYGMALVLSLAACQGDENSTERTATAADHKLASATVATSTQDVKKSDVVKVELNKQLGKSTQEVLNEVEQLAGEMKPVSTSTDEKSQKSVGLAEKQKAQAEKLAQDKKLTAEALLAEQQVKLKAEKVAEAKATQAAEALKNKAKEVVKAPVVTASLGDAVAGKKLAKRCSSCHSFAMKDKVGPHLQGVFNRAAGQSGFKKHAAALKAANWNWDEAHLLKWLCDSKAAIKEFSGDSSAKTKMPNQKMCGQKGLDIVAYLKTI